MKYLFLFVRLSLYLRFKLKIIPLISRVVLILLSVKIVAILINVAQNLNVMMIRKLLLCT